MAVSSRMNPQLSLEAALENEFARLDATAESLFGALGEIRLGQIWSDLPEALAALPVLCRGSAQVPGLSDKSPFSACLFYKPKSAPIALEVFAVAVTPKGSLRVGTSGAGHDEVEGLSFTDARALAVRMVEDAADKLQNAPMIESERFWIDGAQEAVARVFLLATTLSLGCPLPAARAAVKEICLRRATAGSNIHASSPAMAYAMSVDGNPAPRFSLLYMEPVPELRKALSRYGRDPSLSAPITRNDVLMTAEYLTGLMSRPTAGDPGGGPWRYWVGSESTDPSRSPFVRLIAAATAEHHMRDMVVTVLHEGKQFDLPVPANTIAGSGNHYPRLVASPKPARARALNP